MYRLARLSNLDTVPSEAIRRTTIIGTIGPNTNNVELIVSMRKKGMNIIRMNCSHGDYEFHRSVIRNARISEERYSDSPLALALDTKGPEIRTGDTIDGVEYGVIKNHELIFTTDPVYKDACDDKRIYIEYDNLANSISAGQHIFVDDGKLSFEVMEIVDNLTLKVRPMNSGSIGSYKCVHLPGVEIDLPVLSEKDKADLHFALENGVNIIFASNIRSAEDIKSYRKEIAGHETDVKIIAKIEGGQGVDNFDEILEVADGILIARGDLGVELSSPRVLALQKKMIAKCNLAGKPVVCATQMLESMTYNPMPTRAEVSDVGNAVLDGADCLLLSSETSKGEYPVKAVEMMHQTIIIAEHTIAYRSHYEELVKCTPKPTSTTETIAVTAVAAVFEQNAKAIIVLSTSGETTRLISKYRPRCPIIMVTRNEEAYRFSLLYRGVFPLLYLDDRKKEWSNDVQSRLMFGVLKAKEMGLVEEGDAIVSIQGFKPGIGNSNTVRIAVVGDDLIDEL